MIGITEWARSAGRSLRRTALGPVVSTPVDIAAIVKLPPTIPQNTSSATVLVKTSSRPTSMTNRCHGIVSL